MTSVADGTATITAESGSASATTSVTVAQVAATVTLSKSDFTFTSLADTTQLTATVTDANGETFSGATVTWASSDTTKATVSSAGLVTSVADGTATITAESGSASATASAHVVTCTADSDSDRLTDCVETGTGTYVDTSDTGTDPNNPDTDGDGISDGDEVLGTEAGLDLPGLGVSPLVPSILIEYDWFDDSGHTHRPTATQLDLVTAAFSAQGIEVIHDYGQGPAPLDGGNLIDDDDGNVDGFGDEFYGYKADNFDDNRNGYFHYAFHPHRYNNGSSSGLAEINGDDLINATLGFYNNDLMVAGTIQHELGHNLNLRHGGNINMNRKPNYNSVMSYNYQFYGVDNDCTPTGDGIVDYSHGLNPDLDENDLDETQGICGPDQDVGWDWNEDGDETDTGLVADINRSWRTAGNEGDGIFGVLRDHDDWGNLSYSGLLSSDGVQFAGSNREVVACPAPPDFFAN